MEIGSTLLPKTIQQGQNIWNKGWQDTGYQATWVWSLADEKCTKKAWDMLVPVSHGTGRRTRAEAKVFVKKTEQESRKTKAAPALRAKDQRGDSCTENSRDLQRVVSWVRVSTYMWGTYPSQEKSTWKATRTASSTHTGPGIILVPTRQSGKHHHSWSIK